MFKIKPVKLVLFIVPLGATETVTSQSDAYYKF